MCKTAQNADKKINTDPLYDIHGIMSMIYKQVIELNIEANNVWKCQIWSIATGEAITFQTINISTYTQLRVYITLRQLTKKHIYYLI